MACVLVAACATQTAQAPASRPDAFVIAGDACGASRYAHLVGEQFAETHRASMPQDANVIGRAARTTLEYEPGRLNVVLDGRGRIVAIGCF
jgi:hypothetical protein